MRDVKRISRILTKLGLLWKQYPDMRFGQLLSNFIYKDEKVNWFKEDDSLEEILDNLLK